MKGKAAMHGKREDIPVVSQFGSSFYRRDAEWGDMNVAFVAFPAGTDSTGVFKGLPNDRCQCPHWGYLLKGRMRIKYADHDELVTAGEAYYMAPGHDAVMEEDCEVVEFSPKGEEYQQMWEAANRNMAAMQRGG
jgi:hypothetical protein